MTSMSRKAITYSALKTIQQPTSTTEATATLDTLVERHLGLVMRIARRYERRYQGQHLVDLDDLVQEGMPGLIRAAERFDVRKGFQFSTYATYWIRQAIGQTIMTESRTIRLPATAWSASRRLAQAQAAVWQHQQREPSADELAEALQYEPAQVLVLLQHQHQVLSLEQPVFTEQESTETMLLGEQIAAPDNTEDTEQRERQEEVADLLNHLTRQERQVIEYRYQLGQAPPSCREDIPVPYTAVGRHLQITAELVKSVESRALRKMRFWAQRRQCLGRAQPIGAVQ